MTDTSKGDRTKASAVELSENELGTVTGGVEKELKGQPLRKGSGFDGKANDLKKTTGWSLGGFEGDKSK